MIIGEDKVYLEQEDLKTEDNVLHIVISNLENSEFTLNATTILSDKHGKELDKINSNEKKYYVNLVNSKFVPLGPIGYCNSISFETDGTIVFYGVDENMISFVNVPEIFIYKIENENVVLKPTVRYILETTMR